MKRAKHSNILLKALFVLIALTVFAASCFQKSERINPTITSSETPIPPAIKISDTTFEAFSHKVPEHKQFECNSCHQREGRSLKMEFAGHDSCIGCHLNQFTNPKRAMCAICHEDLQSVPPSTRKFPTRFREGFNMKFDHAAHTRGNARPAEGCVSCHSSSGAGKSIPAGFNAHTDCYTCHTAESKIGSCNVCHELAPYSRTPQSRYVFRAVFSHNEHSGVGCNECHTVNAGAAQSRQVTTIVAQEHDGAGNNCASCHNGSRSFDGNDLLNMSSCARCHSGPGFDMLPGSPP
jgi:c(7)-type cytochrome triheme protein